MKGTLLAKKYCIVLSFIFKQFYSHFKVFLRTIGEGTFSKLAYTDEFASSCALDGCNAVRAGGLRGGGRCGCG